jgi:hypothetical protein
MILFHLGAGYRSLNKWDQSIEAHCQLYTVSHPKSMMLPLANELGAGICLEQFCTDMNLDFDERSDELQELYLSVAFVTNEEMAQTYLEPYCTGTNLIIDQRTQILHYAIDHSEQVHKVSPEMHLIRAQLSYFNGDKRQAYHHLELCLVLRVAECKLRCYTCKQRIRHGSVPFTCVSCRLTSYCFKGANVE